MILCCTRSRAMKNGSVVWGFPDFSTASLMRSLTSLTMAFQSSRSSFRRAQGNPFQDSISSSSWLKAREHTQRFSGTGAFSQSEQMACRNTCFRLSTQWYSQYLSSPPSWWRMVVASFVHLSHRSVPKLIEAESGIPLIRPNADFSGSTRERGVDKRDLLLEPRVKR